MTRWIEELNNEINLLLNEILNNLLKLAIVPKSRPLLPFLRPLGAAYASYK